MTIDVHHHLVCERGYLDGLLREMDSLGIPVDQVATEPPALPDERLTGDTEGVAEPGEVAERAKWEPREEILQIEKTIAQEKIEALERARIPRIERIKDAPDVILPLDREEMQEGVATAAGVDGEGACGCCD